MSTPYSESNQLFSDKGHLCAQKEIYPKLFDAPIERLSFRSTSLSMGKKENILDGEMAIDRIISISVKKLKFPIEFTVQERFRRIQYQRYQDITITEFNMQTGQKSELYKLNSGIFVYGYYDETNNTMGDWIALNTVTLLHRITRNFLSYSFEENRRSNQKFICLNFKDLIQSSVAIKHSIKKT